MADLPPELELAAVLLAANRILIERDAAFMKRISELEAALREIADFVGFARSEA